MTTTSTDIKTTFTNSLPESGDALEVVVRAERQELKRSLDELGSAMRDKVDVRSRLREQPLIAVGVALASGVALGVMSNMTNRSDLPNGGAPAEHVSKAARVRPESSRLQIGKTMGTMAATVAGAVGQRLASVAEDIVRSALPTANGRSSQARGARENGSES